MFLETLDNLMKKKDINKHTLAKESGVPYTTIVGFYKKGYDNIKLSTLNKLSDYFGVSLDYLVKGVEIKKIKPAVPEDEGITMYKQLNEINKAMTRGYMERLLDEQRDNMGNKQAQG